ncbi:hypothetical protein BVG16_00140 [Paenibacillus selenitireducens]|uniref:DNA-binding response regulator n=1 Tax=Paenibacillus selenitireducens TaxID=1324314 RepID=A0A1T2XLQ8_9BACL|nr:response regulator [Paenibacillus selenitireducens]OPA80804.1 hypothetical protein BVG16_00140 [Paenibacillus selenitireducens]
MISVIIVDDEYLIRERLKISVNWEELGYEIVGEAANGEDALLLLEHAPTPIQLAIVDINMPIVDGLAFAEAAHQHHPELKIMILTGYNSFEYAKSALKAGVSDYLLKPLNMVEMTEVLNKIAVQIHEQQHQKSLTEDLKKSVQESYSILRRTFIQGLLAGAESHADIHKIHQHCPNLNGDELTVMVISIDKTNALGKNQPVWQQFAVLNIFSEFFAPMEQVECSWDEEERLVLLMNRPIENQRAARKDTVEQRCAEAVQAVARFLKFTVTAGIGGTVHGFDRISQGYKEALYAVRHRTIYGGNRVISFDHIPKQAHTSPLTYIRETMIIHLRLGNWETIEGELHHMLMRASWGTLTLNHLYVTLYELVFTLNMYAAENKLDITQSVGDTFQPAQLVDELERLEEIKDWIRNLYHGVLDETRSLKQSTPARLVEKAKQYIDEHFASELDLERIAKSIYINPSYLSRIFKIETGFTVVEYLTKCRMVKAKELMESGCKNLYFVAEMVGYNDAQYFSKCFKKHFSVPPSKFISRDTDSSL